MPDQEFIVTDPPHGSVDYERAASLLGLDLEVATPKMDFGAPEVLSAADPGTTLRLHRDLADAGLTVEVVSGRDLARVPWPTLLRSFAVTTEGLAVDPAGHGGARLVPWDARVFAVSCRPPKGFPRGGPSGEVLNPAQLRLLLESADGPLAAEAIQWCPVLDLYVLSDLGTERFTIARDVTDFTGLAGRGETSDEHMVEATAQCALHFRRFSLDRRLEGVRPRQRFAMGATGFDLDQRKLFSYGTLLLRQALNSVDPSLGDLTQYEFGSRIAWLLRGRDLA